MISMSDKRYYVEKVIKRIVMNHIKGEGYGNINYLKGDILYLFGPYKERVVGREALIPEKGNWGYVVRSLKGNTVGVSLQPLSPVSPINVNQYQTGIEGVERRYGGPEQCILLGDDYYDLYEMLLGLITGDEIDSLFVRYVLKLLASECSYPEDWIRETFYLLTLVRG